MLTQKNLKEQLNYNKTTGIFVWLVYGRGKNFLKEAGCKSDGYVVIQINGKSQKAHRLAWLYEYGYMPRQVDHINHVRSDNRICNLREATQKENMKNSSISSRNRSGVTGVCWCKRNKKWLSQIMVDGRTKHLGYHLDKFEAICARKSANNKYGFHENHGSMSAKPYKKQ